MKLTKFYVITTLVFLVAFGAYTASTEANIYVAGTYIAGFFLVTMLFLLALDVIAVFLWSLLWFVRKHA